MAGKPEAGRGGKKTTEGQGQVIIQKNNTACRQNFRWCWLRQALSYPPNCFLQRYETSSERSHRGPHKTEIRQGPSVCIGTDSLHPKASRIRPRGHLSPSAGGGSAVQPRLSASLYGYVPLNDAPPFHGPPSPGDGPTKSDRLVNFENGLCEAKQETQYGNPAIFRRGQNGF
jgi:hypothetical protein